MRYVDNTGRIFYHHDLWEEIGAGLYDKRRPTNEEIKQCADLLSNQHDFMQTMMEIKQNWKCSYELNLSNKTINRKAWLGQAACCYKCGVPFNVTIEAWSTLTEQQQKEANNTAQQVINLFEVGYLNGENIQRHKCTRRCKRTIDMDF